MSCLFRIKEFYDGFTASEKKIADYILNNKDETIRLTSTQLSEITGASPATVVRFARTMGFSGYSDMKLDLAKDIDNIAQDKVNELIRSSDTMMEMVKKYSACVTQAVAGTMSLIKSSELESAVSILKKAETIYLYGVGASGLVAEDLQKKLVRINKRCNYYVDYNLGLASSIHITGRDAMLAVSYSGETREVNLSAETARRSGAKVIAVTHCGRSRLTALADINLFIPSTENEIRIGAMQSRTAQLFITDLLYMGLVRDQFGAVEKMLEDSRKIVRLLKEN